MAVGGVSGSTGWGSSRAEKVVFTSALMAVLKPLHLQDNFDNCLTVLMRVMDGKTSCKCHLGSTHSPL